MKFSSLQAKIFIPLLALLLTGVAFIAFRPADGIVEKPVTKAKATTTAKSTPKPKKAEPKKPEKEFRKVKGLHVTGWITGGKNSFQKLIDLCNKTELNALCIDVKDSDGVVSWDTNVPLEREIKASRKCIADIEAVMRKMKENDIYPIARIVCFKDPILAKAKPEMAVHQSGGGLWKDRAGVAWASPYDKRVWDYNIDLAIECAKLGFKEIQWDYVRFPSDGRTSTCVYPNKPDWTESQAIMEFLKYSKKRLEPYGVVISADIFGLTSLVKHDMGIGQTIQMIAEHVDYICPMVYPSHYAKGEYGIPDPNRAPYKTVLLSVGDAVKKVEGTKCKIRPWLQDFSLYGVRYGKEEVQAQFKACRELGVTEYLLWNPRCKYTESALGPAEKSEKIASAKPTSPKAKKS